MEARRLIEGVAYGPDELRIIGEAFDQAWIDIAGNFGTDAQDVGKARLRLANAVLAEAAKERRDVAVLKRAALERMALDYRAGTDPGSNP